MRSGSKGGRGRMVPNCRELVNELLNWLNQDEPEVGLFTIGRLTEEKMKYLSEDFRREGWEILEWEPTRFLARNQEGIFAEFCYVTIDVPEWRDIVPYWDVRCLKDHKN